MIQNDDEGLEDDTPSISEDVPVPQNDEQDNVMPNDNDKQEESASETGTQTRGRSGLRSGTRVDYSSLHKFGEKQLNQVHKTLMRRVHGSGNMRGNSSREKGK